MPDRSRQLTLIAIISTLVLTLGLAIPGVADEHGSAAAGSATADHEADHDRAEDDGDGRRVIRVRRVLERVASARAREQRLRRVRDPRPPVAALRDRSFSVYHGPVDVVLTTAGSDGHQLGDLRVTAIETTSRDGRAAGRLDATLTTTAIDVPNEGDEIRIGSLIFSFGDDLGSQIVIDGTATYPAEASTIATGAVTVRPVVGGSGRYRGATGSARTTHLDDGSWEHTFTLSNGAGRSVTATSDRVRDGLRRAPLRLGPRGLDRGAARDRARQLFRGLVNAARREAREAARDARKKARAEAKAAKRAEKAERKAERDAARDGDLTVVEGTDPIDDASEEVGITRIDLGLADPGSAPGEQLGLWQYAIPAGSELVPHTHPGWQIARIARGELEYTVLSGQGTIIHEDGSTTSIGPGTYLLEAGDSVVENPDLEHLGANRTTDEVIIIAATLYEAGAPLAIPLEEPVDMPVEEPAA